MTAVADARGSLVWLGLVFLGASLPSSFML
jgi:hypothetical protein